MDDAGAIDAADDAPFAERGFREPAREAEDVRMKRLDRFAWHGAGGVLSPDDENGGPFRLVVLLKEQHRPRRQPSEARNAAQDEVLSKAAGSDVRDAHRRRDVGHLLHGYRGEFAQVGDLDALRNAEREQFSFTHVRQPDARVAIPLHAMTPQQLDLAHRRGGRHAELVRDEHGLYPAADLERFFGVHLSSLERPGQGY